MAGAGGTTTACYCNEDDLAYIPVFGSEI